MQSFKIYSIWPQASKQADIHTTSANAVTLVWGSLRLAPINELSVAYITVIRRALRSAEKLAIIVCVAFVSFRFVSCFTYTQSCLFLKSVGLKVSRCCPLWLLVFQTKNCSSTQKEGYSSKHYMLEFAHINPSEHFRVYTTASTDCNSGTISDLMHRSLVVPTYNAVTALSYCCGHEAKWWPGISFRTKMMHNIVKILSV